MTRNPCSERLSLPIVLGRHGALRGLRLGVRLQLPRPSCDTTAPGLFQWQEEDAGSIMKYMMAERTCDVVGRVAVRRANAVRLTGRVLSAAMGIRTSVREDFLSQCPHRA